MTEELTASNLHQYLWHAVLAMRLQNEKIDYERASDDERGQFAIRQGAAMLAQELIARYGLGPRSEEN